MKTNKIESNKFEYFPKRNQAMLESNLTGIRKCLTDYPFEKGLVNPSPKMYNPDGLMPKKTHLNYITF
jgi:hypothetical protein